ncbi:hypothetical protein [Candidatus Absconditicoccus praedator]|uniref:hypothetical protein n=1 Tax=Candidatus Absconditicoccus praedator TaxID=2735562 RepID=UPI001E30DECD|nr:hypothetical protein [Candidatus Absconditicoccus praedator]UFX83080.1 hypothetical protein HLG78_03015 [Candidatus Absconditicoccus praedator]
MDIFFESDYITKHVKKTDSNIYKKDINNFFEYYLQTNIKDTKGNNTFLINENRFYFYSFPVFHKSDTKFTINDLNNIIEEKKLQIKKQFATPGYLLFYNIEYTYVDGLPADYIIGEKGDIFFYLNLYYLNIETSNIFRIFAGNNFSERSDIKIFPSSFFTVNYLKNNINKSSFAILYINEDTVKIIYIKNGFYDKIESMKFGISSLRSIFEENNLVDLYKTSWNGDDIPGYSYDLLIKNFNFYNDLLIKRFNEVVGKNIDVVLISSLLNNKIYMESLLEKQGEKLGGYILPFRTYSNFDLFGQNWDVGEIDILTYLNSI